MNLKKLQKYSIILLFIIPFSLHCDVWWEDTGTDYDFDLSKYRILVIIDDDFDYLETVEIKKHWEKWGAEIVIAGFNEEIEGHVYRRTDNGWDKSEKKTIKTDLLIDDIEITDYHVLFYPGGSGPDNLLKRDSSLIVNMTKAAHRGGLIIGGICHGPLILAVSDIVNKSIITGHPDIEEKVESAGGTYIMEASITDGNIVTGNWPYFETMAVEIAENLLYKEGKPVDVTSRGNENEVWNGWGKLRKLGDNINSTGKDEHVTLTGDGVMFFASIREGGSGTYDIYTSRYVNGEWTQAEPLPYPVNTEKDEYDPFVTLDGRKLLFASNRNNGDEYWDCDIFISNWTGNEWSNPVLLDSLFAEPNQPDWGPTLTEDQKLMIFSSGRTPVKGRTAQIFKSEWLGDKWTVPVMLDKPVNSGIWEATPFIIPDGSTLYLNSARGAKGKKDVDIWKFEYRGGKWANPVKMKGPFYSEKHDYDPCISPDGEKFYFTSTRDGSNGADIYVVEKFQ